MTLATAGEIVYVTVSEQFFRRSVEQLVDILSGRLRLTLHGFQYLIRYSDVILHHALPLFIITPCKRCF
jgi:hypothetical protein